jgi:hypothetical protein
VQALATLVTADGDPAIDGFADAVRPPSTAERAMLDTAAALADTSYGDNGAPAAAGLACFEITKHAHENLFLAQGP